MHITVHGGEYKYRGGSRRTNWAHLNYITEGHGTAALVLTPGVITSMRVQIDIL
jgi:hypothetical protein